MPEPLTKMRNVVLASRYWAASENDFTRLHSFLTRSFHSFSHIILAINVDRDKTNAVSRLQSLHFEGKLQLLKVSPWGGVTHALNLILYEADVFNYNYIMFQSPEVFIEAHVITQMHTLMQAHNHTLVLGCQLPDHQLANTFHGAQLVNVELNAFTVPWNTIALWNLPKLKRTAFPSVADLVKPPGMEEVAAIYTQHKMFGVQNNKVAMLCKKMPLRWDTKFDGERAHAHNRKMATKAARAQQIIDILKHDSREYANSLNALKKPVFSLCLFPCHLSNQDNHLLQQSVTGKGMHVPALLKDSTLHTS